MQATAQLSLKERTPPETPAILPIAVVPYDNWSIGTDFVDDIPALLESLLSSTNQIDVPAEPLPANWIQDIAFAVLLLAEDAPELTDTPGAESDAQAPALAEGSALITEDWGSVELIDSGGRNHVIVRNLQESVLFEGMIDSEADRTRLRPLRPMIRERVEELLMFGDTASSAPPLQLRTLRPPPRFL